MRIETRNIKIYIGNYIGNWVFFSKWMIKNISFEMNIIPKNYLQFYKKISKGKITIKIYNLSIFQLIIEEKN